MRGDEGAVRHILSLWLPLIRPFGPPSPATTAFSHIFTPYLLEIGNSGGIDEMIFNNKWFMKGVYAYKGSLTNAHIGKKFNIQHKELSLLIAARM